MHAEWLLVILQQKWRGSGLTKAELDRDRSTSLDYVHYRIVVYRTDSV